MLRLASSRSVKALQATPFFPRMLSKCTSDDLPLIRMIQQKQPSDQKDDLGQEQRDAGEIDDRIYCLASFKETWDILSRAASDHCRKSLCIVADAGDVAGAPVELFFAYSPVCERGALLPHQVGGELVRPRLPGPFSGLCLGLLPRSRVMQHFGFRICLGQLCLQQWHSRCARVRQGPLRRTQ